MEWKQELERWRERRGKDEKFKMCNAHVLIPTRNIVIAYYKFAAISK